MTVGRILRPKGLAGGLHVEPLSDVPERLAAGSSVYLEGEATPRTITAVESGGRTPVIRLAGIEGRDAAEAVAGRFLEADAPELPAGTYYWHQLEGLRVLDERGAHIGTLTEIFRAGGNEVYRVTGGDRERLVPALRSAVLAIDLDARTMTVRYEEPEEA